MADLDKAISLIRVRKINVHACYAIIDGEKADRDALKPQHFKAWVDFAKERNMGIDFNPTFFSHNMVKDNLTLSSPDENVRKFWVEHGKACIRIANYFAEAGTYLERHLYGDELLYITHMELIETCPTLSKDLWQALRKELNEN